MKNFSNEIEKSLEILKTGKILLYPTDTVWGIGCDATNELAIKKIFHLKNRNIFKTMILLVDSIFQLSKLVKIPTQAIKLIKTIKRPLTIVYQNPKNPIGVSKVLISQDQTLAIRLTKDLFCKVLIQKFGKPLVSTSANYAGQITPLSFDQIDKNLFQQIDYVVNLRRQEKAFYKNSFIIKFLKSGKLEILRK